jgi:arginyl-tRNA synthetase
VITRDLRRAIARAVAAAGFRQAQDPGLRPTGTPGQYAASVALALGGNPRETAAALAGTLAREHWIAAAEVTGPGYLTVTVAPAALAAVAADVIRAGPACVTSDALAGQTVPAVTRGDPLAAPTWEKASAALAARLTARLAAAAGATMTKFPAAERDRLTPEASTVSGPGVTTPRSDDQKPEPDTIPQPKETRACAPRPPSPEPTPVARAVAFAGRDAVTFTLARAIPGRPLRVDQAIIARHVPGNPAYAVRYAHARAASGVRWAVASQGGDPLYPPLTFGDTGVPLREATAPPRPPADPAELAILDALSWLPERVATAARRGRPDEFARYLEDLASVTIDVLSSASHPGRGTAPGSDRLILAGAARVGLAAGLGLLEVSAPERLLADK